MYQAGDQIGPYKITMLSRDYKDKYGNWYGTFICPECGTSFQARIKNVADGTTHTCGCYNYSANLIGVTKGVLTIIQKTNKHEGKRDQYWKCKCICGEIFEISTTDFNRRNHEFCLHQENIYGDGRYYNNGRPPNDLTNMKFGLLTAKKYLGNQMWECVCDCGNMSIVRSTCLTGGYIKSCGCVNSRRELLIKNLLKELNIKYEKQKIFNTCVFPNTGYPARFDFYLTDLNVLIEYNGIQHYSYRKTGWDTKENYEKIKSRDEFKINWCKNNNIPLIIIPYTDYNVLTKDYLLSLIKNVLIQKIISQLKQL